MLSTNALLSQISVRLPDTTAEAGARLKIPIRVLELTPFAVTSFRFVLSCDTSVATLEGVEQEGTVAQEALVAANNHVSPFHAGSMKVACASAAPLSGRGVLVYIVVAVKKTEGATPLKFSEFVFNGGSRKANVRNGSLESVARKEPEADQKE
jgi:hypothetical protein